MVIVSSDPRRHVLLIVLWTLSGEQQTFAAMPRNDVKGQYQTSPRVFDAALASVAGGGVREFTVDIGGKRPAVMPTHLGAER